MEAKVQFIDELKKILENEDVTENFVLEGVDLWDSLAVVSTLALFDQIFQKRVSGDDIWKCKTVSELLALV
jgi:acyl carrier protein